MTISAYILFTTKLGKTPEVISKIRSITQFQSVAVVTGEWDIVARIQVKDLEELYEITSTKLHLIQGIIETHTAVIEKELAND